MCLTFSKTFLNIKVINNRPHPLPAVRVEIEQYIFQGAQYMNKDGTLTLSGDVEWRALRRPDEHDGEQVWVGGLQGQA